MTSRSGKIRRIVFFLGAIALLAVAAVWAALPSWASHKAVLTGYAQGSPDGILSPGPGCELVTLHLPDGTPIVAQFGPALTDDGRPLPHPERQPTIILFYGMKHTLASPAMQSWTKYFRSMGLNTLMPDFPGYGMSGGHPSEDGFQATGLAAYDYLLTRRDVRPGRIEVGGGSLGAASAIDLASKRPVAALLSMSGFTRTADMGYLLFPWAPRWLVHHAFSQARFDNVAAIQQVACPILIVHGTRDNVVPPGMARELESVAKGKVTRIMVPGANHGNVGTIGGPALWAKMRDWLLAAAQPGPVPTPTKVQEAGYVMIGGIKQWIQIRGDDRLNPVLLFVHGGPGASTLALSAGWRSWEQYFTVVQWDQRGAGMTYLENGDAEAGTMTMDRMTDDGIEVAEYLRAHLHQDKILLVGHSWGTILGVHMVKKRPFLFSAYVGTGQFVNPEENEKFLYAHVLAAAKAAKNEPALTAVEDLGRLSYRDGRRIAGVRDWADRLDRGLGDPVKPFVTRAAPGLPAEYYPAMGRAMLFSRQQLGRVIGSSDADLPSLGPDFELPVFFFEGTADQMTPLEPAQAYFELIRAPHKEFVRFEGDHHFVAMNRPEEFLRELLARVRPWTVPAP